MKLASFAPNSNNLGKVDFTFSRPNKKDLVLILREKSDWPLIWGQPLEKVEKWFFSTYWQLFDFPLDVQNLDN